MSRLFKAWVIGAPLMLSVAAGPAAARRIVVDTALTSFTPCTVGTACVGTDLGFTINPGDGATSTIFLYDNGLTTVGSPLPASFTSAPSIAAIGQDVITPAYSPAATTSGFQDGTGISQSFSPFPGSPFFRENYVSTFVDASNVTNSVLVQFTIYQLTDGAPGDFALQFAYSDPGDPFSPPSATLDPNALIGFRLGSNLVDLRAGDVTADILSDGDTFQYVFRNTAAAVPEPSTWAMLVGGFGFVGMMLRRPPTPARRARA